MTGTDGFIGRNILEFFKNRTTERILTVDFNSEVEPFKFLENLKNRKYKEIGTIVHNGACSDTTNNNPSYMMRHNFEYTADLFRQCLKMDIRLIYASSASVYGDGPFHESANKSPKNLYAMSKSIFDDYCMAFKTRAVGLRYFNVYGKYEEKKNHMASVVYKFFHQVKSGKIQLFANSDKFLRDFIHIEDVCELTMDIFNNHNISGVFNIGTGKERSFQDIADIFVNRYGIDIEYIEMPKILKGKYQKFTKSDNTKTGQVLPHEYLSLEEGTKKYLDYLEKQ
tara:strand:- start:1668 stop:2513 length:846 start_codon:yes stop_codon:yes gene_type:complete